MKTHSKNTKFGKAIYCCTECRKPINYLESMLFVEDSLPRGFCSEKCIETYFAPLVDYYAGIEEELRKQNGLEHETCLKEIHDPKKVEELFIHPQEIWCLRNAVNEEVYTFIKNFHNPKMGSYYLITLATVFDYRPSFIFILTATQSVMLLKEFQIGERIEDVKHFLKQAKNPVSATSQQQQESNMLAMQLVEGLKAQQLAEHLQMRKEGDISFDLFYLYDNCLSETLQAPDEIYQFKDKNGQELLTFIKAIEKEGVSFYYYVVAISVEQIIKNLPKNNMMLPSENELEPQVVPICSWPSLDGEIYRYYSRGQQVLGGPKN